MRRRLFLKAAAAGAAASTLPLAAAEAPRAARRPVAPYRVWYQPRLFARDMSLYQHMTIDASGWLDPRLCERAGVTGLLWAYGPNHPDATDSKYWQEECSVSFRSRPRGQPELIVAGVALDEWTPPKRPELEAFVAEGLRAARRADPSLFIAVWFTDMRPALVELLKDGTVDLAILEGYTHTAKRFGPEAWLAWPTCLRRCDACEKAGVLDNTIFCFGHITAELSYKGERLQGAWLTEKAHEIKARYPAMPGIAFYEGDSPETPELRELVRHCDALSAELWP